MTSLSLRASLTWPLSTSAFSAPRTLMPLSSGISSPSLACSVPGSMVTTMSRMKQRPSALCMMTFMEPAFLPRKNSSVGLSSVISTLPTPSVSTARAAAPGAAPGPAAALATLLPMGALVRLPDWPPTTMRATGSDRRMTLDLPNVTRLGGSTTTDAQGCNAGIAAGNAAGAGRAAAGRGALRDAGAAEMAAGAAGGTADGAAEGGVEGGAAGAARGWAMAAPAKLHTANSKALW